jgi:hypothetical protein
MKNIIKIFSVLLVLGSITSCVSDYDRVADAKKKYPNAVVTPSTGIIKQNGYEITVEDTLTHQIYAINYYPFSTTKIATIVNIR